MIHPSYNELLKTLNEVRDENEPEIDSRYSLVIASAKKTGKVITVEEHNIIGGLGEAVCACLSENCPTPVKRIGVNDEFGHSGPALDLLKQFGLSAEHIAEVAEEFVK